MPLTGLLTTDDLDEIGGFSFDVDQPLEVAAELVDAVDQGLVADQAETGYALTLAAEISEREGDLPAAVTLAARAIEANRTQDGPDHNYPRALHAELLLRLGREDEAMAEFTALRPVLFEDADAVSYISEALVNGGRPETAEQWLTEALDTQLQHRTALESHREDPAYEHATVLAFSLMQQRHRVRRELDLPHDEHDYLADQLMDAVHDALIPGVPDYGEITLLFWPRPELDQLLLRWPGLAAEYGQTWDQYRTAVQRGLVLWTESAHCRLALLAGSVEDLAEYADRTGGDPTETQVRDGYLEQLAARDREIAWPPGRNQPCWCGSAVKYKKCCLPRGRG